MSYKNLCVHVDYRPRCHSSIRLAMEMAEQFDAHLTGVFIDPVPMSPELVAMSAAPVLLEQITEEQETRAATARIAFDEITASCAARTGWRRASGPMYSAMNIHGRYCDLLILNQEGEGDDTLTLGGFADSAVIETGRPVLVVPFIGAEVPLGGKILVAWNGSREAARAVNDAMPLLEAAKEVRVVCIEPETTEEDEVSLPGADLCFHLATHGVRAEAYVIEGTDMDCGNVLLSHAADYDANLIVAGAYGHSRLRELVLGGMTLHLLRHMTVPVLMSH